MATYSALCCAGGHCGGLVGGILVAIVSPEAGDRHWGWGGLSGEPCGPPCFWGIVPGQTTEAEAIAILQARGVFTQCEVYVRETYGCVRGIICPRSPPPSFGISLSCEHNLVEGVSFGPSVKITVQDVIAKYGNPAGVLITLDGIPEKPYLLMTLLYPEIQTCVGLPRQEWPGYLLRPATPILGVGYALGCADVPTDALGFEGWKGYGEYGW